MTPRAHSSMAEQPAHNRLGLGSSPGGPTIVAGAWRPALTAGGLIEARVAPVGGQPERSGRVAPLRGQPDCCSELVAPVRGQPERSRRGWLRSADNPLLGASCAAPRTTRLLLGACGTDPRTA